MRKNFRIQKCKQKYFCYENKDYKTRAGLTIRSVSFREALKVFQKCRSCQRTKKEVPKDETEKKKKEKCGFSKVQPKGNSQSFHLNSWKKQIWKSAWCQKCQKSNNPSWRRKRPRCSNSSWAKATSRQLKGLKSKKNYLGSIE